MSVILMRRGGHTIVRVIKRRRMRWVGHVAHMGEVCIQCFGGRETAGETQA
jgi:hypothetical protein